MLCAGCMAPIVGKYLNALGQKWHPEHFSCALCMKSLASSRHHERRDQAYCDPCYVKMFG
jgi:paxillin